jgi:hypothetical protein
MEYDEANMRRKYFAIGTHIARKTTYCGLGFAPLPLIADTAALTNHHQMKSLE